jgi:integrase
MSIEQINKIIKKRSPKRYWIEKNGTLYARLQYFGEDGKYKDKYKPITDKRNARRIVEEMRQELERHGEETLKSDKVTFAQLAEKYTEAKVFPAIIKDGNKIAGLKSVKPIETYVRIASAYFGKRLLRSIKSADIEKFKRERLNLPTVHGRERKTASVNRELATLRAMLSFAYRQGYIYENPFQRTEKIISLSCENERNRVLSFEEESRLLEFCNSDRSHLKAVIICAVDTALRNGEIFNLIWSDIDIPNQVIRVRREISKTGKERLVFISNRLRNELEQLWHTSPRDKTSKVFGLKSVRRAFNTACRLAEIKDLHFHDLRHTATTRMVQSRQIPQGEIMKMTGHDQLKTFLRYLSLTELSLSENAKSFSDYLSNNIKE